MTLKEHETTDDLVIDLTKAEYFAGAGRPPTRILLTLPDRRQPAPPTRGDGRQDVPLAVPQIPVRRHRLRARLGSFDPLTVLAISVVVAVGVVMATMVVTFRH